MHLIFKLLVLTCLVAVAANAKDAPTKKLQIGIKRRVENCAMKSRRGDLLHMHYTVYFH